MEHIRNEYGCELSYGQQNYEDYGYGSEPSYVQKNYPDKAYADEQIKKELVDNEEDPYSIVSFETDQEFNSLEELKDWVKNRGTDNSYVIVTKRSKKKGENGASVWLQCSLSGENKSKATMRKTGSKKIGCPFSLKEWYDTKHKVWRLDVLNEEHNHSPSENLEGYAYARRLSSDEYKLVEQLAAQNIPTRNIWKTITKQNPKSKCLSKDIHNVIQKINAEKRVGESPMQQLEHLLFTKKYTYYTRENPSTNVGEEVFFVHELSYKMWRAFPHVLMIDATYKTNMYKLPFIQVVGMASTNQSFAIANAFVSNEKEENYIWVLEMIKSMLEECSTEELDDPYDLFVEVRFRLAGKWYEMSLSAFTRHSSLYTEPDTVTPLYTEGVT
ncbi:uncharacterized protein LOC143562084 [Bidens hawaiensis]|uniref:uncharacterized protein LOC143562084 n=1 Tax=Bidens hawaiensis TaxID=980011 RepID=UPI00404A5B78